MIRDGQLSFLRDVNAEQCLIVALNADVHRAGTHDACYARPLSPAEGLALVDG